MFFFIPETFLARIALPLPGQSHNGGQRDGGGRTQQSSAHSYAPEVGWYTYCSEKPVVVVTASSYQPERSTGALLCTVEYDVAVPDRAIPHYSSSVSSHAHLKRNYYDGINREDLGLLPLPSSSPDFSGLSDGRKGDFARERDFQALLYQQDNLDQNDPRNEHLLYLQSRGPVIKDRDVFLLNGLDFSVSFKEKSGIPYTNYVALSQPLRMRLLMLRDLKPHLFTVPIPLSEDVIKNSDLYMSILSSQSTTYSSYPGEGFSGEGSVLGEGSLIDDYDPDSLTLQHLASKTRISSFLEHVRDSHTALTKKHRKKKQSTASAVAETEYYFVDEMEEIIFLPPRKRALRPKANVRTAQTMDVSKCDLLIQIVGAKNVPLRVEIDEEQFTSSGGLNINVSKPRKGGPTSSQDKSLERDQVEVEDGGVSVGASTDKALNLNVNRPLITGELLDATKMREKMRARTFVEVQFQEGLCYTTGMEGGSPLWKQSLSLPFRPPSGDYTPDSLSRVRPVFISFFMVMIVMMMMIVFNKFDCIKQVNLFFSILFLLVYYQKFHFYALTKIS